MYLVSYSPNSVLRNSTGNRFCSAYCWRVIPGGGFLGVRALFLAASLTLRIFATSEVSHFSPQHLKLSTPKNCRCGREHFGHSYSTLPPLFVGAGNTLCSSWWVNLVDVDGFGTGGRGERSEEHTPEIPAPPQLRCPLLLGKKKKSRPAHAYP